MPNFNSSTEAIFALQNISFCYGTSLVLENLNLLFHSQESVVLLGANGSGKSTLLKILAGLQFAKVGKVIGLGRELNEKILTQEEFGIHFRTSVGIVFQNSEVQLFNPTVRDEIAFGPLQICKHEKEVWQQVSQIMERLQISHLADRSPYSLSGGEKKKVAIASILVLNPQVILLDEPTSGLDPRSTKALLELLVQLHSQGKTLITATHDLAHAQKLAERIVVLGESGEVLGDARTAEILANEDLLRRANLID